MSKNRNHHGEEKEKYQVLDTRELFDLAMQASRTPVQKFIQDSETAASSSFIQQVMADLDANISKLTDVFYKLDNTCRELRDLEYPEKHDRNFAARPLERIHGVIREGMEIAKSADTKAILIMRRPLYANSFEEKWRLLVGWMACDVLTQLTFYFAVEPIESRLSEITAGDHHDDDSDLDDETDI